MSNDYNASEIDRLVRDGTCRLIRESNSGPGKGTPCGKETTEKIYGTWMCAEHAAEYRRANGIENSTPDPVEAVRLARSVIDKYGADADKPSVHLAVALLAGAHERDNMRAHLSAAKAEVERLTTIAGTFDKRCADRLADEVAVLVRQKIIDARSPAADALLDYREPPSSDRADRMARLEADRDRLSAKVERLTKERDEARNRVLRPLTEDEVVAALHEGRAERRVAEGDNAWTSLVNQRDRLAAEVERLTKEASVIADIVGIDPNEPSEHSVLFECAEHIRSTFDSHRRLALENTRLSVRVRELELTEDDREALAMLRSTIEIEGRYGSKVNRALALLDRLVKGGR